MKTVCQRRKERREIRKKLVEGEQIKLKLWEETQMRYKEIKRMQKKRHLQGSVNTHKSVNNALETLTWQS